MENNLEQLIETGDLHIATSADTPLREDAFVKSDDEKILAVQYHFARIMEELGLDLSDDSLKGTPYRVAKMYVKEIFSGLNPKNKPCISVFENKYRYDNMLIEKNIEFFSACEHHFLPMPGFAHVAYIPSGKVIGLSKINRVVKYYAKRPQVQERLTRQILEELKQILDTEDVIVALTAKHLCVSMRGTEDKSSSTVTILQSGKFKEQTVLQSFLKLIEIDNGMD